MAILATKLLHLPDKPAGVGSGPTALRDFGRCYQYSIPLLPGQLLYIPPRTCLSTKRKIGLALGDGAARGRARWSARSPLPDYTQTYLKIAPREACPPLVEHAADTLGFSEEYVGPVP